MNQEPLKVLIVDDHELLATSLAEMLNSDERIEVVGVVHYGVDALDFLGREKVNAVLVDYNMPGMNGVELIREINLNYPEVKCYLLTMIDTMELEEELVGLSIEEFLEKGMTKEEITSQIFKRDFTTVIVEEVKYEDILDSNVILIHTTKGNFNLQEEVFNDFIKEMLFFSKDQKEFISIETDKYSRIVKNIHFVKELVKNPIISENLVYFNEEPAGFVKSNWEFENGKRYEIVYKHVRQNGINVKLILNSKRFDGLFLPKSAERDKSQDCIKKFENLKPITSEEVVYKICELIKHDFCDGICDDVQINTAYTTDHCKFRANQIIRRIVSLNIQTLEIGKYGQGFYCSKLYVDDRDVTKSVQIGYNDSKHCWAFHIVATLEADGETYVLDPICPVFPCKLDVWKKMWENSSQLQFQSFPFTKHQANTKSHDCPTDEIKITRSIKEFNLIQKQLYQ